MLVAFPFQLNLPVAATTPVGKAVPASCHNLVQKALMEAINSRGRAAAVKFELASKISQKCNDNLEAAINLNQAAELYGHLGEKQKAIEYFKRAISLAQTVNTRISRDYQRYLQSRIQYFTVN